MDRTLRDIIARQQRVTGCVMMSNVLHWNVKRTTEISAVIVCTHVMETNDYQKLNNRWADARGALCNTMQWHGRHAPLRTCCHSEFGRSRSNHVCI